MSTALDGINQLVTNKKLQAKTLERLKAQTVVAANGCHEYKSGISSTGYCNIRINGRIQKAHRVSYVIHNNETLSKTKNVILHTCDNRLCVNPEHLVRGTQYDNVRDAINKGSHVTVTGRKLTKAQRTEIVTAYTARTATAQELAAAYGIHKASVLELVWRWRKRDLRLTASTSAPVEQAA